MSRRPYTGPRDFFEGPHTLGYLYVSNSAELRVMIDVIKSLGIKDLLYYPPDNEFIVGRKVKRLRVRVHRHPGDDWSYQGQPVDWIGLASEYAAEDVAACAARVGTSGCLSV